MQKALLICLIATVVGAQKSSQQRPAAAMPHFTKEQLEQIEHQQRMLAEIEPRPPGLFGSIRNMFSFGSKKNPDDIEDQLAPSSHPKYHSKSADSLPYPTQPYRPGHPRLTRRRLVTRVILRRRNPPLRRNQIERDMEDEVRNNARDHRRLDKELLTERRYYQRNKDPRDPNNARQAVPDPRRETQYGFAPSKLYKKPMPQLDFTSKLIGYQGDKVFKTGLTTY